MNQCAYPVRGRPSMPPRYGQGEYLGAPSTVPFQVRTEQRFLTGLSYYSLPQSCCLQEASGNVFEQIWNPGDAAGSQAMLDLKENCP